MELKTVPAHEVSTDDLIGAMSHQLLLLKAAIAAGDIGEVNELCWNLSNFAFHIYCSTLEGKTQRSSH